MPTVSRIGGAQAATVAVASFSVVLLFACSDGDKQGMAEPTAASTARVDMDEGGDPGRISVNGRELYLDCRGSGQPTAVMEAGGEGHSGSWRFVQPGVANFTRVCAYDRAGAGQSDPAPDGRHGEEVAEELHALLQSANVPPPYVLVGHSLGGILVRYFALRFPDDVVGMVLIDTSHGDQRARTRAVLTDEEWQRVSQSLNEMGPPSITGLDLIGPQLGDLPLIVLSAGQGRDRLSRDVAERLAEVALQMHEELAALSTRGVRIIAEESGHGIPQEQPQLVVEAIRDVVNAAAEP